MTEWGRGRVSRRGGDVNLLPVPAREMERSQEAQQGRETDRGEADLRELSPDRQPARVRPRIQKTSTQAVVPSTSRRTKRG